MCGEEESETVPDTEPANTLNPALDEHSSASESQEHDPSETAGGVEDENKRLNLADGVSPPSEFPLEPLSHLIMLTHKWSFSKAL